MAWTLDQILANPQANAAFGTWMHANDEGPAYDFLSLVPQYRATPTRDLADQLLDLLPRSTVGADNSDRVNVADNFTQELRNRIDLDPVVRARSGNPPSALSPNDFDLLYRYVHARVGPDYDSQLARFFKTPQGTQYAGDNSPYKDALNRILDNNEAVGALYKDTMDREVREKRLGRFKTELTRNIDFLLAVRAYKANPTETRARDIYKHYVTANGKLSLSLLPNVTRAAITQRMPPVRWTARFRTGPVDLFDTAESNISGAIAYLVPDFHQKVGDAQFAQWIGDAPPGGADDIDGGGLDHMGDGLAEGEIAEGGDNGINPPPPAPEPAPDIDPPEPPADPDAHDDPGRDHDHDESKSDGPVEAIGRR
jgi:hypothetical protein